MGVLTIRVSSCCCDVFGQLLCRAERAVSGRVALDDSQTVNDWTVRVFGEIWDRLPPLTGCSHGECLILNPYVREAWIGDQVNFHTGKKEREGRARKRLAMAGNIVLPVTIAAASLHLMLMWLPDCA